MVLVFLKFDIVVVLLCEYIIWGITLSCGSGSKKVIRQVVTKHH